MDRQQFEMSSVKINFGSERTTAILRKTTDPNVQLESKRRTSVPCGYVPSSILFSSVEKGMTELNGTEQAERSKLLAFVQFPRIGQ
uniref:Uncharacterized protein n=1 Tax=Romanomermis culicivorax TaxID=13658 RepID=A0A915JE69_ROMCU